MKVPKNCIGRKLDKPFKSNRKYKKKQVCVKDEIGDIINVHYGDKRYRHNYSKAARKKYINRSAGIKNKKGEITKDKKTSANYWSRRDLWKKKRS